MEDEPLVERLRKAGLEEHAEAIAALALPAIRLATFPADDADLPVGSTKIGGAPDLPPDVAWPEWQSRPLAFLAQCDLREFAGEPAAEPLPRDGLLSFFYDAPVQEAVGGDPGDRGAWRVLWSPHAALARRPTLEALFADATYPGVYQACRTTRHVAPTFPPPGYDEVWDITRDHWDEYRPLIDPQRFGGREEGCAHQLLGYPVQIQGEMQDECTLGSLGIKNDFLALYEVIGDRARLRDVRLRKQADGWRLLFQLDSDMRVNMLWGDLGMLYFWIRADDLAWRRFQNVWMVLQCY